MKAPDKITISKYNISDDGDVVFAWVDKLHGAQRELQVLRATSQAVANSSLFTLNFSLK